MLRQKVRKTITSKRPSKIPPQQASAKTLQPVNIDAVDEELPADETTDEGHVRAATPKRAKTTEPQPADVATDPTPDHASTEPSTIAVEGASFKGVLPGVTTLEEMEDKWGPAKEIRKSPAGLQYIHYLKPFKQVIATLAGGKVDTIIIHLETVFEPTALAKQLKLDDIDPATIYNSDGQMLGMAFPERGVLFGFAAGSPVRVAQIVVEPVNAQPFVTRAESNCCTSPTEALIDVEYAIEIDPDYDRSYGVRASVFDSAWTVRTSAQIDRKSSGPRSPRSGTSTHACENLLAHARLRKRFGRSEKALRRRSGDRRG